MSEDQKILKGNSKFVPQGKKNFSKKHTIHALHAEVFDNAFETASKLGLSVSEYLARVLDETHDLD